MKELKFVERVTDRVWVAFIAWMLLILIARKLPNLGFIGIFWETVFFALEATGVFLFIKAVYKWYKKPNHNPEFHLPKLSNVRYFMLGVGIVIIGLALAFGIPKLLEERKIRESGKYQSCLNACDDSRLTRDQESICKRHCIENYFDD